MIDETNANLDTDAIKEFAQQSQENRGVSSRAPKEIYSKYRADSGDSQQKSGEAIEANVINQSKGSPRRRSSLPREKADGIKG